MTAGAGRLAGVIFDLDGTLADTVPVCCAAYRHAFTEFVGRSYADEELAALFGPDEEGIIRTVLAGHGQPEQWAACLRSYLATYAHLHDAALRPFPGVARALGLLQERAIPLAVVTGKGPRSAAISLDHLGLRPYFPLVEVGSPDGAIKPRSIRRVLQRWRAAPGQVAYVGDSPYDMQAAREAGVLPLGAAWAPHADGAALAAHAPRAIFTDLEQFVAWLGGALA